MGDSCCPLEFICEHYLTFSKSLLRVIPCLLSQRKNCDEILKTKEKGREGKGRKGKERKGKERKGKERKGKGELESARGSEHESIFTFKMLSNWFFFTTSRAESYSAHKINLLHCQC